MVVVAGRTVLGPGPLGEAFAQDLAFLRYSGARPVVVHDAGSEQVSPYPGEDAAAALRRVAAGLVQRRLVGLVNAHGPLAVGITGEDGRTLTLTASGGLVADTGVLRLLLDDGRIPVVAAVAGGPDGAHPADVEPVAHLLAAELPARLLLLPQRAHEAAPPGATPVDMAVPHALLRTVYGGEAREAHDVDAVEVRAAGRPAGPAGRAASPTAGADLPPPARR
ncbi:hypothetical protein [Streptomyces sp. MMG1121]|uniref:amino acid kinase family protein n=1 Tax=Streptomyces sp. MMG1121 TaxID=1415544 RepID=UPI0006AF0AB1|nr:hypothetical protein [Streptomyces sp. MMG1121]